MKLQDFRVQNFRSVVDSGNVRVDDVTALIGPNEAGKSSLLQGLASISMGELYGDFDLTQLEGVAKKNMDGDLKSKDIEIVWANFILDAGDKEKLITLSHNPALTSSATALGQEESQTPAMEESRPPATTVVFRPPDSLEVRKYYDGFYEFELDGRKFRFPSKAKKAQAKQNVDREVESFLSKARSDHMIRHPNNQYSTQFDQSMKQASEISIVKQQDGLLLVQKLEDLLQYGFEASFKNLIKSTMTKLNIIIKTAFPATDLDVRGYQYLLERMPRTVYFRTYERIEDTVPIKELRERPRDHKTFINFLTLAEINLTTVERLIEDGESEKVPVYLENGCGLATKLLREAWPQEILDVELRYLDGRLMVFTKNSRAVETLLPPSSGSEGFQWYFGFYVNFGAATKAEYKNAILLLDDPGVFLHPSGHKQLLGLFEKYLQDNVTTIYSTHLPFLIPRDNLERLRLVEKDGARSKIHEKFWSTSNKDVLYPLRAALGVTLADSLHIGARTIIAEGPSDRILLGGLLREFAKRGIRKIKNIEDIEILSGRGARGAVDDAVLLQIERLPYVIILDNDQEGNGARKQAIMTGIPEENIVTIPLTGGTDSQREFDIEDMIPLETYTKALVSVHGVTLGLNESEVRAKMTGGNEKVNNRARPLLKSTNHELDKVAVAREIVRLVTEETKLDGQIEKRFSNLFDIVNKTIELYE